MLRYFIWVVIPLGNFCSFSTNYFKIYFIYQNFFR